MGWIVAVIAAAAAVAAAVRAQNSARAERIAAARAELAERQAKAAEARTAALTDEIRQLARERIPAAALALSHPTAKVPGLREAADVDGGSARLLTEAVQAARAAVVEERGRVDAAARAAMRGTSAKIQSLLNQSQQLLHELQHEYDDPRILQLDFRNELALRRTQATAVLCDAWPGLARQNSPLVEIVLGAQSRVAYYERIKVANHLRDERLALVARAAEPSPSPWPKSWPTPPPTRTPTPTSRSPSSRAAAGARSWWSTTRASAWTATRSTGHGPCSRARPRSC